MDKWFSEYPDIKKKENIMNKTWVSAFGFIILTVTAVVWAAPVPDTGLTKCYDVVGSVITCPSSGQDYYGQDSNYSINPMSYTKLDDSGKALPDSATSWSMVKDNVTGLIWEMKTNKDGVKNYNDPHDADNTYSWYDSSPATNGGWEGIPGNGTDTEEFIKALNDAHYGGYSDWRLPAIKELAYIINYGISSPGPMIDSEYFPNTQQNFYWSSTAFSLGSGAAWGVRFNEGKGSYNGKGYSTYVRAVRGEQPGSLGNLAIRSFDAVDSGLMDDTSTAVGGYTDNGDGTVTDTSTGLMWQQATPSMTWWLALVYCEGLNLGGYMDWRMPTIKELLSLVDFSHTNPSINTNHFPNTNIFTDYWSSTANTNKPDSAWGVSFDYGDHNGDLNKSANYYVRAVRGGQAPAPPTPDIKANGRDGQITVSFGTPVSITASLAPGNGNGKLADWWLAFSSPAGWYSLNSYGWTSGINLLTQYPLFSISPVEIYSSTLPVGDYAFYFLVDMSTNGIVDSPFYYDIVQLHVVN